MSMFRSLAILPCVFLVSCVGAGDRQANQPRLKAEATSGQVDVYVDGTLFTTYEFGQDLKYPQFYPVNGPRTGESVTIRQATPYPHHSSLFFGCDKVNGGNYWQEGLDRGQIISKDVRILRASGHQIVIEQDSLWERPGAEPPFADYRKITIHAPSPDLRVIDFDVTLTALIDVRIERTNHSLFSARMAPELSTAGGGKMVNAHGASGEAETFGKPAPWMDARGTRNGETEGLAILDHSSNPWAPTPWFTRDYGFFSPTPLDWLEAPLELPKGETLRLRYRVLVHGDSPTPEEIERLYQTWIGHSS